MIFEKCFQGSAVLEKLPICNIDSIQRVIFIKGRFFHEGFSYGLVAERFSKFSYENLYQFFQKTSTKYAKTIHLFYYYCCIKAFETSL